MSVTETGIGAIFSAAHRDKVSGKLHGHTYEVVAWFAAGQDALSLQAMLQDTVRKFDHADLDAVTVDSWAEAIAGRIRVCLPGCVEVEVRRPLERLYARARG